MAPMDVHIKHSGRTHTVQLDPDLPPGAFKENIYQVTGVPVDRMKVMVKGGVLKDDTPWKKIAPKAGQTFMVIGTAGELPKAPEKPIVFLEDMDDEELANALVKPAGLKNLGNTCYMNSTLQALRAIPELQVALNPSAGAGTISGSLPPSLKNLYDQMSKTTEAVVPFSFLSTLRQVNPQFGEMDRGSSGMSRGYAQQDAEECYSTILNSLRSVPAPAGSSNNAGKFIEKYMEVDVRRELKNTESPEEPPTISTEKVMKIECNISSTINYMATGISNSMSAAVEKHSSSLGRTAQYTQTSRLTRLPAYLTVHMVRFAWKADVNKKAKIMRKVKFPLEYDALDITSDELKEKLVPASRRLKEVEKERSERRKVRKRTKAPVETSNARTDSTADANAEQAAAQAAADAQVDAAADALLPEPEYRIKERTELQTLVDDGIKADVGCSWTGLYELVAIITHKGAAADSGHYIGFVKKSMFLPKSSQASSAQGSSTDGDVNMADGTTPVPAVPATPGQDVNPNLNGPLEDVNDEDWYKFDDDKVSVFPKEKLATLDGGGEDSSAYVLLYRTKSF